MGFHHRPAARLTWCSPGSRCCPSGPHCQGAWVFVWTSARPAGPPGRTRRPHLLPASSGPHTCPPRCPEPDPRTWSARRRSVRNATSYSLLPSLPRQSRGGLLGCGVPGTRDMTRRSKRRLGEPAPGVPSAGTLASNPAPGFNLFPVTWGQ